MNTKNLTLKNSETKKEAKMGLKSISGSHIKLEIDVDGTSVTIHKLSVAGAKKVQDAAKKSSGEGAKEDSGLDILKTIIRNGTEEVLSDEDFEELPMDTLQKVASAIMKHSGMAPTEVDAGNV
jgi:hypothetical protein